jgi:S1-C subfamily serine protease
MKPFSAFWGALLVLGTFTADAMSRAEIVNRAKPSVVAIMPINSATKDSWEGTGWFVSGNRIVTNSHVISSETYDSLKIVNIATGKEYTVNHVAYNNTATDIAVLVVNETNSTYLGLSSLRPDKGL